MYFAVQYLYDTLTRKKKLNTFKYQILELNENFHLLCKSIYWIFIKFKLIVHEYLLDFH